MGTHGLTGLEKLFFGSTTARVLRGAPGPVFAVPPARLAPPRKWPAQLIAAVDLEDDSGSDIRTAAGVARYFDADLTLVHVVPPLHLPAWLRLDADAANRRRVEKAGLALQKVAEAGVAGRFVDRRVLLGHAPEAIAALVVEEHADLLVLPVRRGPGALRWGGPIGYRILASSSVPILVLPVDPHGSLETA